VTPPRWVVVSNGCGRSRGARAPAPSQHRPVRPCTSRDRLHSRRPRAELSASVGTRHESLDETLAGRRHPELGRAGDGRMGAGGRPEEGNRTPVERGFRRPPERLSGGRVSGRVSQIKATCSLIRPFNQGTRACARYTSHVRVATLAVAVNTCRPALHGERGSRDG